MSCTYRTVQQIARAFPEVTEGVYFDTPAFYMRKKMMLRLWEDGETLVAKVDPADRARYLERWPDTFYLTEHYRSYPTMLVYLTSVSEDTLRRIIEGAWRFVAPKRLAWSASR